MAYRTNKERCKGQLKLLFDNVRNWQNWKRDLKNKGIKQQKIDSTERRKQEIELCWYNNLVEKYGKEFAEWAKQNRGKIFDKYLIAGCKNAREYYDKLAQKLGCRNNSERVKIRRWNNGECSPMSENYECASYFGVHIAENYISKLFEDPVVAPYGTRGYDWICKKGKKIELKSRCLQRQGKRIGWNFTGIDYNTTADYFMLSGWKDRESLLHLYVLMFHRKDMIRGREFWDRESFYITNRPKYLIEFRKYELKDKLDKLKELCNRKNDDINEYQ